MQKQEATPEKHTITSNLSLAFLRPAAAQPHAHVKCPTVVHSKIFDGWAGEVRYEIWQPVGNAKFANKDGLDSARERGLHVQERVAEVRFRDFEESCAECDGRHSTSKESHAM
jgi:hypothetical protein